MPFFHMWILHELASVILKECNSLDPISVQQSSYGPMLILSINQKNLQTIDLPSLPGPILSLHHWMMDFAFVNIDPSLNFSSSLPKALLMHAPTLSFSPLP